MKECDRDIVWLLAQLEQRKSESEAELEKYIRFNLSQDKAYCQEKVDQMKRIIKKVRTLL